MSIRKYPDYKEYLTKLKYNSLGNYLSEQNYRYLDNKITSLQYDFSIDYLKKTENIYLSRTPNFKELSLDSMTSIITQPIDLTSNYFSIFQLPLNSDIPNGTLKNIINTCSIIKDKIIYIYCINSTNNTGGFSNLGELYNCYVFPYNGDNLELSWNLENKTWCVKKYGGYFINFNKLS